MRIWLYLYKKKIFSYFSKINLSFIDSYYRIFKFKSAPLVISFYADHDDSLFYQKCALRLHKRLSKWGVDSDIIKIDDQGGYQKNCLYKPKFIYTKLLEHKRPVLWIDADTDIKDPRLLKIGAKSDFFAFSLDGSYDKMQAGLLFFNHTRAAIYVLREWMLYCGFCAQNNLPELDHEALKHCILPQYARYLDIEYRCSPYAKIGFTASNTTASRHAQSKTIYLDADRSSILDNLPTIVITFPLTNTMDSFLTGLNSFCPDTRITINLKPNSNLDERQMSLLNELEYTFGTLAYSINKHPSSSVNN